MMFKPGSSVLRTLVLIASLFFVGTALASHRVILFNEKAYEKVLPKN